MQIDQQFRDLDGYRGKEYEIQKKGLPQRAREGIANLCKLFEKSSYEMKKEITGKVVPEISFLFLVFSELMANTAVRRGEKQRIVQGLEAVAIENCVFDARDSALRLALLHHSALKIGTDPEELIRFVAAFALETAKKNLFEPFLSRSPESRQLANFGLKEG